jgi:hypothetical protein
MPKIDYSKKVADAFFKSPDYWKEGSSRALTVFTTMHNLFPNAEWSKDVPALKDKNFVGWWNEKFDALSKTSKALKATAVEISRNKIGGYLKEISTKAAKNEDFRDTAVQLSGEFNRLITQMSGAKKLREQKAVNLWTAFEGASASLLIRVSANIQAGEVPKDPKDLDRVEGALKLAEEEQRLVEIVGEPPDDLKLKTTHETSAQYLKAFASTTGASTSVRAKTYTDKIVETLENKNNYGDYLSKLTDQVKQVRQALLSDMAKTKNVDRDLARASIMIGEALTPEYTRNLTIDKSATPRSSFTDGQLKALNAHIDGEFEKRVSDAQKEDEGVEEKKEKEIV